MDEQQINEYRQPWESDEHWTLRKEFIEKFWEDFPEDRLLCLAQVYSNVELLGCSYPAAVMRQIHELSKDLNECKELRGKRKERAAVQFVKAKQKAPPPRNSWNSGSLPQKRPDSESNLQANCDKSTGTSSKKLKTSDSKLPSDNSHASVCNKELSTTAKNSQQKNSSVCVNAEKSPLKSTAEESNSSPSAPSASEASSQKDVWPKCIKDNMTDIIQFIRKYLAKQNTPLEILNNMVTKFSLKVAYSCKFFSEPSGLMHECSIEIDNVFIAKAKELSKKKARSEAAKLAVDLLLSSSEKIEKSSCSTSSESSIANNTRIQDEQKCLRETSGQSLCGVSRINTFDADVKSSGCSSTKTTPSANGKGSLLVNKSSFSSVMHENAPKNSLLPNLRICHDLQSERVTSDDYKNSSCIPSPWTNNTAAGPDPWINNAVTVSDPLINVTQPNSWTVNNTRQSRPLSHQSCQESNHTNPCPQFLAVLDNSDITKSDAAASIFTHSANFNHVPFLFEYDTLGKDSQVIVRAQIILNGQAFCSAEAENKQAAKEAVSKVALDILRKTAYTIKVNDEHEGGFTVTRSQVFNTAESNNSLPDSNIGCKLLKMMGWSGGGIGKTGKQGIEEPVKAVETHKFGQGLGYTKKGNEEVSFTARAEQIIQDYAKSKSTSDLIFSTEFSKEERKKIHRIACKYNLKNNSKGGKGDGRHIIISRRYTAQQLINCLIQAGGRTHKYELISPTG